MKKIYAFALAVLPLIGFSQFEIIVIKGDSVQSAFQDSEVSIKMKVKNTDSNSLNLKWVLLNDFSGTITPNWTNYVCEGLLCYPASVRSEDFNTTMNPGDEVDFFTYIATESDTGTGTSCVVVFDPLDSAATVQEVCLTAKVAGPNGIENSYLTDRLSQNAPNPFAMVSRINYELNGSGSLRIQDLTGKIIREYPLESGINSIQISDLNSGMYFYSLYENGTILSTKRMQVVR